MVDTVAVRAGVEVVGLAAIAAAGDVLAIVVMIGVVRVVMTGEVRDGIGSRVVKAAMTGVVRVARVVMIAVVSGVGRVVSGNRVVRAVMTVVVSGVDRVVSGNRVVRAVMTVVVHVAMGNVMTAVRDSVMIAMMRQSLQRSNVARRCSLVRARVSTAKTSRLPNDRIGTSVSSTRARCATSAFGVMNPSVRSASRGGIEVARRSQHHPL